MFYWAYFIWLLKTEIVTSLYTHTHTRILWFLIVCGNEMNSSYFHFICSSGKESKANVFDSSYFKSVFGLILKLFQPWCWNKSGNSLSWFCLNIHQISQTRVSSLVKHLQFQIGKREVDLNCRNRLYSSKSQGISIMFRVNNLNINSISLELMAKRWTPFNYNLSRWFLKNIHGL